MVVLGRILRLNLASRYPREMQQSASVLGGRLIGVGCESLSLYHACLGVPSCRAGSTFSDVEVDILTAAESLANKCMDKARIELEHILGINESTGLVHAIGSFDGAYQMRSGKAGVGFSRYCFASIISSETSKVLQYVNQLMIPSYCYTIELNYICYICIFLVSHNFKSFKIMFRLFCFNICK